MGRGSCWRRAEALLQQEGARTQGRATDRQPIRLRAVGLWSKAEGPSGAGSLSGAWFKGSPSKNLYSDLGYEEKNMPRPLDGYNVS